MEGTTQLEQIRTGMCIMLIREDMDIKKQSGLANFFSVSESNNSLKIVTTLFMMKMKIEK